MITRIFHYIDGYPRNDKGPVFKLVDPIERYVYPDTRYYRFVIEKHDGTEDKVVYLSYEDTKSLFNQLLPEFMVKDEDDDSYISEEDVEYILTTKGDVEYTLTPKGRAIAEGMQLRSVEVKTTQYDDGTKMTESTEFYSHDL